MSPTGKVSLTQKYLPADCWTWLSKKTSFGTTVYDCCKSALENPDSNVGLYAPDPEVYDLFAELFHPVIAEYHKVDVATLKSVHDLGDAANLRDLPQNYQDAIVSTRVRVGRTVKGYPMAGKLSREKRVELEGKIRDALLTLDGDLAGTYSSLIDMTKEEKDALIEEHILYNDGEDRFLASAGGYSEWPYGRGIFMNHAKNFIVWANEEDHIRIISMQKGASLKQVWSRLVRAIHAMETRMEFVCHPKFGHLTFCPTNIGTGLRASVHVKVPNTAASGKLDTICASMDLQPRGIHGEHTESVGGVYDISNKIRIGRTEWDLINTMWVGVEKLLDNELGAVKGDRYEGEWRDDKKNGKGVYYFASGNKYEGEWKDGKENGQGVYYFASGSRYEGQFKDGNFNGKGTFYYASGDKYEGEWKDGKKNGSGTFSYASGEKHEGNF